MIYYQPGSKIGREERLRVRSPVLNEDANVMGRRVIYYQPIIRPPLKAINDASIIVVVIFHLHRILVRLSLEGKISIPTEPKDKPNCTASYHHKTKGMRGSGAIVSFTTGEQDIYLEVETLPSAMETSTPQPQPDRASLWFGFKSALNQGKLTCYVDQFIMGPWSLSSYLRVLMVLKLNSIGEPSKPIYTCVYSMLLFEIRQAGEGIKHVPLVEGHVNNMTKVWDVLQNGTNARVVSSTTANEHRERSHWYHPEINYCSFEGVLHCKPHYYQLLKKTGSLEKSFEASLV
ncbi:hypothetical protein K1719_015055 [Acacia pycnantha]|nr:hypothetical protein K1719_015055 [Acacia pycnantha]